MSTNDSEAKLQQVRDWLKKRKPDVGEIDLDFDLIDNRVIDSLSFVGFLFFLEEITERDLQEVATTVHPFRTLRTIRDNILQASD